MTAASPVARKTLEVNGTPLSYLEAGDQGVPPLLLLHGTFWSRVWQPVLPVLGTGLHCMALDFPGFGLSGGSWKWPTRASRRWPGLFSTRRTRWVGRSSLWLLMTLAGELLSTWPLTPDA